MSILQNALKVTDNGKVTYLKSCNRHDFVNYDFVNGGTVFIDGGLDYFRFGATKVKDENVKIEDFGLTSESCIDEIREKLLWGTNGLKGDQPTKYLPIKELTLEHLQAIITNMLNINPMHQSVVKYWILQKQNKNKI